MVHDTARKMAGAFGLAAVILSWTLTTNLLWSSLGQIVPMYGLFEFSLTVLGWEIVISLFGLGVILLVFALLAVLRKGSKMAGAFGLAAVILSWMLKTTLLSSLLRQVAPLYGRYAFTLTTLGWEIAISLLGLGAIMLVFSLSPIFHKGSQ
jgi:hypothetical protein